MVDTIGGTNRYRNRRCGMRVEKVLGVVVMMSLVCGAGSCSRVPLRSQGEDLLTTGLVGWQQIGGQQGSWKLDDGVLYTEGGGGGWLSTVRQYDDFELSFEFRVSPGANSGVFLRAPHRGDPAYAGMEIQIIHDQAEQWRRLKPNQYTGSIYGVQAPSERVSKRANEWQTMVITCRGPWVKVVLNGEEIVNTNTTYFPYLYETHPGLTRPRGYIGFQDHGSRVEFRDIRIKELVYAKR